MNEKYPFQNKPLPYAYDAIEPYIDQKTMELHHDKHLQSYVDNLNFTLKDYPQFQKLTLERLIYYVDEMPLPIRRTVKNNAGGVYNHNFYFDGLTNESIRDVNLQISNAIKNSFGSYEYFMENFKSQALSVFGAGYAWLVMGRNGKLKIVTTQNQDTVVTDEVCPILNIDVWEHAYYLKHYNKRADYIDNWFHVINWERADIIYRQCNLRFKY